MKRITIFLTLFCLSPVGITEDVPLYETITDNVPKIGVTTEVYPGDRMLEQRTGDYRECIIPKKTFERMIINQVHVVAKANQPICKENADSKSYFYMGGISRLQNIAMIIENDKTYELHLGYVEFGRQRFTRNRRFKDIDKKEIEVNDSYFIYQKESFQQTIEYAGKSGNMLKFVYSEFIKGLARDAFNREFQVDLNEGNVLAFKGALIEIESATNINIRYKVIRNFRD